MTVIGIHRMRGRLGRPGVVGGCAASLAAFVLVALLTAVAIGCSKYSPPATTGGNGPRILLRGVGPEPDSVDPQRAQSTEAQNVLRDLCEGLTSLDHDASVIPGVAQEWTISPDRLIYEFHLRPDARWSNGDAVVAGDFVAGFRRLLNPATAATYAQVLDVIENAREILKGTAAPDSLGVIATDESHLTIRLTAPTPYLLGLLAHPSTCPIHRGSTDAQAAKLAGGISNGAFVLKEWVHGSHLFATRNRYYWNDAKTRLDGVRYVTVDDENAELLRYRAGELHVTASIPRSRLQEIRALYPDQVHGAPVLWTEFYGLNLSRPPFKNDPKLRRALSLVIDREKLVDGILHGAAVAAYGWVPPGVANYSAQSFDYNTTPMTVRIAEARRLYREAGYSVAHPVRFELRYNQAPILKEVAIAVSSMWREALGADVTLTAVEFKVLIAEIEGGETDAFRSSWSADYDDAYTYIGYLTSGFGINLPRYGNVEYDALAERARVEPDENRRRQWLQEAESIALRDTALIPLYFHTSRHLVSPRIDGWYDNRMNIVYSKDLALRD